MHHTIQSRNGIDRWKIDIHKANDISEKEIAHRQRRFRIGTGLNLLMEPVRNRVYSDEEKGDHWL